MVLVLALVVVVATATATAAAEERAGTDDDSAGLYMPFVDLNFGCFFVLFFLFSFFGALLLRVSTDLLTRPPYLAMYIYICAVIQFVHYY